jgi:transposase
MNKIKRYDAVFKRDAVQLALSSKQPLGKTARDLGVAQSSLCKWVRNFKLGRHSNLSDKSALTSEEIALQRALRELAIVKEERDILKKALGIFSLPVNR